MVSQSGKKQTAIGRFPVANVGLTGQMNMDHVNHQYQVGTHMTSSGKYKTTNKNTSMNKDFALSNISKENYFWEKMVCFPPCNIYNSYFYLLFIFFP